MGVQAGDFQSSVDFVMPPNKQITVVCSQHGHKHTLTSPPLPQNNFPNNFDLHTGTCKCKNQRLFVYHISATSMAIWSVLPNEETLCQRANRKDWQCPFCRKHTQHRTPNIVFIICQIHKLRLPVPPTSFPQTCFCTTKLFFDLFGNHLFTCPLSSKHSLRNVIQNTLFPILPTIAPRADIVRNTTNIQLEPTGLTPMHPLHARPGDVGSQLFPPCHPKHCYCLAIHVTVPSP